jgi:HAD superfamily hydrolase (TIGR01549 family)
LKQNNLYIYSSNSRKAVEKGLKELGILSQFKQLVTRDETRYLKPNPEGFFLIEGSGENKASFLMVGDSDSDEQTAKTVGIDFFKCTEFETYTFKN